MKLSNFDINLLATLHVVLAEGSITRAAKRLKLPNGCLAILSASCVGEPRMAVIASCLRQALRQEGRWQDDGERAGQ